MVLDAEEDLLAGDIKDFPDLLDIELVGMLRTGGKADAGLKDLPGLLAPLQKPPACWGRGS